MSDMEGRARARPRCPTTVHVCVQEQKSRHAFVSQHMIKKPEAASVSVLQCFQKNLKKQSEGVNDKVTNKQH